jgi:SAM-dependent methyltransferase
LLDVGGRVVVHQDLRETSHALGSFDLIVHAEVLEHVPDHSRALAEIYRVLVPGGWTIFTAPFIEARDSNLVRAAVEPGGVVHHLLEPEIHGNPLDPEGSLVFQTFGWELLEDLRAAGLERAEVGFLSDPRRAITNGVVFRASSTLASDRRSTRGDRVATVPAR